jgi:hypothetical protein
MANSSLLSSLGINAYGLNPANYDYHPCVNKTISKSQIKPTWELSIMSVGGGYGSDSSIEFYNKYLNYLTIDRNKFAGLFTDLSKILQFRDSILPGTETEVNYDFELKWLSVNFSYPKYGAVNFTISDRVGLNTNVNSRDEYLPLDFLKTTYYDTSGLNIVGVNMAQSEAIAWWIRKYSIGIAKQFDFNRNKSISSISIGVSASLVHGFGNVSTYESKLNISTYGIKNINGLNHVDSIKGKQDFHTQSALTDFFRDYKDGSESKFNPFPKPAGIGYSFDFGITISLGNRWRIAASVTDLGKIKWNYNTITNDDTNAFNYTDFYVTGTDPTYNRLVDDLGGYQTQDTNKTFYSDMPTKYRAGIMYQPSDKLIIEFNWCKGINNLPGNTNKNIFALGSEYYVLPYLPVRAGVSVGGPGNFYISIGAGVKFKNFTIDIGTHGVNQLIADKRFSVAFSGKVLF